MDVDILTLSALNRENVGNCVQHIFGQVRTCVQTPTRAPLQAQARGHVPDPEDDHAELQQNPVKFRLDSLNFLYCLMLLIAKRITTENL